MAHIPPERLDEIERRLLSAEAPADFVRPLSRDWGKGVRTVWRYVARVRERLARRARAHDPDSDRELIRALLLGAYRSARDAQAGAPDTRGMVQAARTLGELTGVLGPRRVELTGAGGQPIETRDLSADALSARIAALAAAVVGDASAGPADGGASPDEPFGS